MKERTYTATLSRSQGRSAWSMIFRHPRRMDKAGRYGLRVRRGLGTSNKEEAQAFVDQMNELLSDQTLWSAGSRVEAEQLYDPIIIDAFYDLLKTPQPNYWGLREDFIKLPAPDEGYARVLLLGTVGAGKTTVVRQLIGTDPKTERFPSTSASKTTVADLEVVLSDGPEYEAIVTFYERGYIRQHVEECVAAAAMACFDNKPDAEIERELLEHKEQRFRLSYVLGTTKMGSIKGEGDLSEDEFGLPSEFLVPEPDDKDVLESDTLTDEQRKLLDTLLDYLDQIKEFSHEVKLATIDVLGISIEAASSEDVDTIKEIFDEEVNSHENFQAVTGSILNDIKARFSLLDQGDLQWSSGWPTHWTFKTLDRKNFIETVNRFSSNYAPHFGRLLTPVVEGVRVRGPLAPKWHNGDSLKLVLMDGEGLGHTINSTTSVSTKITSRYKNSDVILLVDNASVPMQASPTAVLQSLVSSGHHSKLMIAFTHFDDVVGDNLPTLDLKKDHVLNSYRAACHSVGEKLGNSATEALIATESDHVFFLANTHKGVHVDPRYITFLQLEKMLRAFEKAIVPTMPSEAVPVYDLSNLVLVIERATRNFHERWRAVLKLEVHPTIKPEHWSRVKALSRRLGLLNEDEYSTLKPVADLLTYLRERLYKYLRHPLSWESENVSEEMKEAAIAQITQKLGESLHEVISVRIYLDKISEWERAYYHRGLGSTRVRANAIDQVYNEAAPIPLEVPTPDTVQFVNEIRDLVVNSINDGGGELV